MNSARTLALLVVALAILCFGLAAHLEPQFRALERQRHQSDNFFSLLLGDSRRMFANSFFVKADEYYHSGFYPTIFDNHEAFKTAHIAEDTGAVNSRNQGEETSFMGAPRDWIDAFGRHFIPNHHTHLDEGGADDNLGGSDQVREILPWLKLSARLDPDNIQTYTVTAYWLRSRLHKTEEAEQVLREGLRNNPRSPEILFELGRLYSESQHDTNRARNVWLLSARYWREQDAPSQTNNTLIFEQTATHLGQLEANAGNWTEAIAWFQTAQTVSPTPDALQVLIEGVKTNMAAATDSAGTPPR